MLGLRRRKSCLVAVYNFYRYFIFYSGGHLFVKLSDSSSLQYELLAKKPLYSGFFKLNRYRFRQQLFAGGWSQTFEREIFERGHAVAVLLLDPDKEVIALVEQFRPGAVATEENPWVLELVAGMIEKDELPEEVAKRETIEEAGCELLGLEKICEYLVSPGGSTERIWLYLGRVDSDKLSANAGLLDEHEDIRIHQLSVEKAFEQLDAGQFNNAMILIGLQWLRINWPKKAQFWR